MGRRRKAFGGDVVGHGANPRECVRRIREMGVTCVLGNHDEFVRSPRDQAEAPARAPSTHADPVWAGVLHSVEALDDDDLDWLGGLYEARPDPLRRLRARVAPRRRGLVLPRERRERRLHAPPARQQRDARGLLLPHAPHRLFFDARFPSRPVLTPLGTRLPARGCCTRNTSRSSERKPSTRPAGRRVRHPACRRHPRDPHDARGNTNGGALGPETA